MASKPIDETVILPQKPGWFDWAKGLVGRGQPAPIPEEGYGIGVIDDSIDAYLGMYKLVGGKIARKPGQYHDPSTHYTIERIHPWYNPHHLLIIFHGAKGFLACITE